jgi:hypothetical protein
VTPQTSPAGHSPDIGLVRRGYWEPALDFDDARRALTVALDTGRRLSEPRVVAEAVTAAMSRSDGPILMRWRPEGLWQGCAGLALMCAGLEAAEPGGVWATVGHDQMRSAVTGLEKHVNPTAGPLGLVSTAAAADRLGRGTLRYQKLLAKLDSAIAALARRDASEILRSSKPGLAVQSFDVIAGLTGTGRYLLSRRDSAPCRQALDTVLRALIHLSTEDATGVPHWHTDPRNSTEILSLHHPQGHVNLGLAHGIPGPLALLSIAIIKEVEVDGQHHAVVRIAERILRSRFKDQWGVNYPHTVALDTWGASDEDPSMPASRAAWCYGSPGVARALWLAGVASGEAQFREAAVAAMAAVYARPIPLRRIDSPTICHGVAGLLQITLRFAQDCPQPLFTDAARTLTTQLLDLHEPATRFGFRNLEPAGRVDHPGFLDGAAGVALVLAAAAAPAEPSWDRVLLLS